jgi:hypothetical protein
VPTDLDGFWEREGDIPRDIGYVNALSHLSLVAVQLEDRARAERLYDLLSPYALLNTPNSMLFYEGSASHALARWRRCSAATRAPRSTSRRPSR